MSEWRAVQCQPQREMLAKSGLEDLGLPVWYPYRLVRRWRPGRPYRVRVPYFPGYLFVNTEGRPTARFEIERMPGILAVLGERPIAGALMAALISWADEDGRIHAQPLKPGDSITIGAIVGRLVAIDNSKAEVVIPFLGAMRSLRVSIADLLADVGLDPLVPRRVAYTPSNHVKIL